MSQPSDSASRTFENATLFVVLRSRGEVWRDDLPLEEQQDWEGHAHFMDALESEGFCVLAGPLEESREALIIVRAVSRAEIESRLEADPWTKSGLLRTTRISPWIVRLGKSRLES